MGTKPGSARHPATSAERSLDAVRSIVRALRVGTRAIEAKMGISLAQLFVLQQLADAPAQALNDLAERTATHQSSVSVVVRRLVERGLVRRTPAKEDRRRMEIELTAAGRALLAHAPMTIQTQLLTGLRALPASDRDQLADLLERWVTAAGIHLAAPPMMGEDDSEG